MVRRALLKIEVEAPRLQYVGTEAVYRIRIVNAGTAAAVRPVITATLPPASKYIVSPQSPRVSSDGGKVAWPLQDINPGAEVVCEMTCAVTGAGTNRLNVQCAAEGELSATASATTQAEATANLVLSVEDPSGPVPVESDAVYQIRVDNRGTAAAENVEVLAYFSNGFEPSSAEGGQHKVGPGQVVFDPIPRLAAGQSTVFKIKAKAERRATTSTASRSAPRRPATRSSAKGRPASTTPAES